MSGDVPGKPAGDGNGVQGGQSKPRARPVTLLGKYVRLEPLDREHAEGLGAAAADGRLWELRYTFVPTPEKLGAWIDLALDERERGRELAFTIFDRASGRAVGSSRFRDLHNLAPHRKVEIGRTWIAASHQRTAVNTETKLLMLDHAFAAWRCQRVKFVTDVINQPSRAALERIGATLEGVLRNHLVMPDGRARDSATYSIIASEWPRVKADLERLLGSRP